MQAFLITAYKDEFHLRQLVRFCSGFAKVFVHVDRKSTISVAAVEEAGGVVIKRHRVNWGAYTHLLAIVDLLRMALSDPDIDYVHVISGQDIPLHSAAWFKTRYEGCDEIEGYVSPATAPHVNPSWYGHWWLSTLFGLDKRNKWVKRLDDMAEFMQTKLSFRAKGVGEFKIPFKSLVYVSLPVAAAAYVLRYYDEHRRFRFALRHSLIAEELFFMTILMHSPYADRVSGRDIHYCDWHERNGSYPACLDESDYDRIFDANGKTEYVFARKVDSIVSSELIRRIWEKCRENGRTCSP